MKKILYILAALTLLMLVGPELGITQPGLPEAPNQAPIGGGLAFLAAAGGAYAWKKLRNKN